MGPSIKRHALRLKYSPRDLPIGIFASPFANSSVRLISYRAPGNPVPDHRSDPQPLPVPMSVSTEYDIIVVGAGHAGVEAALVSARMGKKTLLATMRLDSIAMMPCNPAIGGIAKGQLVREIDALGGEMGRCIDRTGIQFKMLNSSKGPAVHSPRAQADRIMYQYDMKRVCEDQENLDLKQVMVENLIAGGGYSEFARRWARRSRHAPSSFVPAPSSEAAFISG